MSQIESSIDSLIAPQTNWFEEETDVAIKEQFAADHPEFKLIDGHFYHFEKNDRNLSIWTTGDCLLGKDGLLYPGTYGNPIFSFDCEKVYYFFRDYPDALTPEEKAIFDEEFPHWANF